MRANISEETKHKVYTKADYSCLFCGFHNAVGNGLAIDHIIPVAGGGSNSIKNYQCLCSVCNGYKGQSTSTKKFKPPNVRGMQFDKGMALIDAYREKHVRPVFVVRGNKWIDKKARTLKAIDAKKIHPKTLFVLLRAIEKTFGLIKRLLKPDAYIERYRLLVEQSSLADCRCILMYK